MDGYGIQGLATRGGLTHLAVRDFTGNGSYTGRYQTATTGMNDVSNFALYALAECFLLFIRSLRLLNLQCCVDSGIADDW